MRVRNERYGKSDLVLWREMPGQMEDHVSSHRPRRVLMLLENNPYPQDLRVRREATALLEDGYQVSVIAPRRGGQVYRETVDGVDVFRFPSAPPGDGLLGYFREYGQAMAGTFALTIRALVEKGFDVIHAANPPDTFALLAVPYKLLGKKFVYDHHDLAPEMYNARFGGSGNPWVYRMLVLLEQFSCRLADHVVATNRSYRAVEMRRGGVPEDRITIVRNGPDLDTWRPPDPASKDRPDKRAQLGYIGVMGFQDGVDYLLRAISHLVYDLGRTDFTLLLIGHGDAVPSLMALAKELKIEEWVEFTGYMPHVKAYERLSGVDICVAPEPSNPYLDQSTAIKVTEYLALGKPVVAFDLPEHRYTADEAAIYVTPNDVLEYARAIALLMDDPARRESMGTFGRLRAEQELAWRYSAKRLVGVYRGLLPGPVPSLVETTDLSIGKGGEE